MSPVATLFLEPLDVLFFRGNKLFGDPGSFGESLMPPWPSVAAGAVRSRILVDAGVNLTAFGRGEVEHPELGKPANPGPFTVTAFHLARRRSDGSVEPLIQPPADLVIMEDEGGKVSVISLSPASLPDNGGLATSYPLAYLPVLPQTARRKPAGGRWLTEAGWRAYLAGQTPQPDHLVQTGALWEIDPRVGVGLDGDTRRAADGRLFSMQAVAFKPGIGFLVGINGATPPQDGTLRLGGDGRAVTVNAVESCLPEPDYSTLASARRCRLVFTSPGLFPEGWKLPGMDGQGSFDFAGIKGRIVSAAAPRYEVVSGWDLAKWQPKAAQRAVPMGSVCWLEEMEASPDALRNLVEHGLWNETCEDASRRAEGFNRVCLAAWD